MDPELQGILEEFLVESREGLDRVEGALLAMEQGAEPGQQIGELFRVMHTLKGTAGFIELWQIQNLAHAAETLLAALRDGVRPADVGVITLLLEATDDLRQRIDQVEAVGKEGDRDPIPLIGKLKAAAASESSEAGLASALAAAKEALPRNPVPVPEVPAPTQRIAVSEASSKPAPKDTQTSASPSGKASTLRVSTEVIDQLMRLAGELVLVRNRFGELVSTGSQENPISPADLAESSLRLDALTTTLQETVMRTRMQPVQAAWNKLPRIIRDVCKENGKQVELQFLGGETELDRNLMDNLRDPLLHLVRNAVDHGIEEPAKRLALGKPETGLLEVRAWHEAGLVHIEIQDDGAGIDTEAVRAKAIERGLVEVSAAPALGDDVLLNLLFEPGFSTAKKVTRVSGRGVGLDVVRTQVSRVGGSIDLNSEPGRGTRFRLKLPLTLAIVPGLELLAAGQRFVIPELAVMELLRVRAGDGQIDCSAGAPLLHRRQELLPLLRLASVLELGEAAPQANGTVVVIESGAQRYGLLVDEIRDNHEIVVKALGAGLRVLRVFSGATILGDGEVALILDPHGLAVQGGLDLAAAHTQLARRQEKAPDGYPEQGEALLVTALDGRTLAVPLAGVLHISQLDASALQRVGRGYVVQEHQRALPVMDLGEATRARRPSRSVLADVEGPLHMLVCEDPSPHGLIVRAIQDLAALRVSVEGGAKTLAGIGLVEGQAAELVDLARVGRRIRPASSVALSHSISGNA